MPNVQYLNCSNTSASEINSSDINSSGINTSGKYRLAYRYSPNDGPLIIWCGGLKSDMEGSKAVYLHQWARDNNHNFIRFDYFGHGLSDGDFNLY